MYKIRTVAYIILIMTGLSCKEESLKTYCGDNYIHFTYMPDRTSQKVEFNFATEAPLSKEGTVKAEMTLWGYLLETDSPVTVSVLKEGTDAIEGTDYKLSESGIFHKNRPKDFYELKVFRNNELLHTDYTIALYINKIENGLAAPEQYRKAIIHVTDKVTEPKWWKQSIASCLGEYSDIKYRIFIIFMKGEILRDLDKFSGIQFANLVCDFKQWWKNEWKNGKYIYYDTDGSTPLYETIN